MIDKILIIMTCLLNIAQGANLLSKVRPTNSKFWDEGRWYECASNSNKETNRNKETNKFNLKSLIIIRSSHISSPEQKPVLKIIMIILMTTC